MTYRFADGADKAAAFERGMSDADAHKAFENGMTAAIVNESYLVVYDIGDVCIREWFRLRLYANLGTEEDVREFLRQEAKLFEVPHVCSVIDP